MCGALEFHAAVLCEQRRLIGQVKTHMTEKILDQFVREAVAAGKSRSEIAAALVDAGWTEDQAKDALAAYADLNFPVAVPRPRRYGSAREAFLYIVYFALLGVVAGYVGALAFAFIEAIFADDLARSTWRGAPSSLRWGIAALIVGYPIFLYLGARLGAARRADPERRTSRVRVWLTYVTLIFAALVLIGDLISVVYHFLSGELGARFLSKAGVVAVISGAILWNYGRDAERSSAGVDWPGRGLALAATIVTAALVVWAFTIVRSPQTARALAADEERLRDLGVIANLIDCHRTYFGEAPNSLATMDVQLSARVAEEPAAPGCGATLPADPLTQAPYAYMPLDNDKYRICAVFQQGWSGAARARRDGRRQLYGQYGARQQGRYIDLPSTPGEHCFEFTAVDFETPSNADEQ